MEVYNIRCVSFFFCCWILNINRLCWLDFISVRSINLLYCVLTLCKLICCDKSCSICLIHFREVKLCTAHFELNVFNNAIIRCLNYLHFTVNILIVNINLCGFTIFNFYNNIFLLYIKVRTSCSVLSDDVFANWNFVGV